MPVEYYNIVPLKLNANFGIRRDIRYTRNIESFYYFLCSLFI